MNAPDGKRDLATKELEAAHEGIHTYGKVQFTIKGWAITVFAAFFGAAADKDMWQLLIPCFFALLLFWRLDSIYKGIQKAYISRAEDLETYLRGEQTMSELLIPNMEKTVDAKIKSASFWESLFDERVKQLYLAMLFITVVTAVVLAWF